MIAGTEISFRVRNQRCQGSRAQQAENRAQRVAGQLRNGNFAEYFEKKRALFFDFAVAQPLRKRCAFCPLGIVAH